MKYLTILLVLLSMRTEAEHAVVTHAHAIANLPPVIDAAAANIFREKCLDCHGGLTGPDPRNQFGNNGMPRPGHENQMVLSLHAPINHRGHMPPVGSTALTQTQRDIIARWATLHAPNVPATVDAAIQQGMITRDRILTPEALAARMAGPAAQRPRVWNIGPEDNIRGAVDIGALTTNDNLGRLDAAEAALPNKDQEIVIYCGCCGLDHCPNVLHALTILHRRGYTNVRILDITGMHKYPGERGRAR